MPRKKSTSSGKQVTARRRRREPVPFAKKPLRMPEAEVAVVMAEWLLAKDRPGSKVKMALDGAHVHLTRPQFRLRAFLKKRGWVRGTPADSAHEWQGDYTRSGQALRIRFRAGFDLRAKYRGRAIAVECKGGPLDRAKGKGTRTILVFTCIDSRYMVVSWVIRRNLCPGDYRLSSVTRRTARSLKSCPAVVPPKYALCCGRRLSSVA